jgi:hypothetical protein
VGGIAGQGGPFEWSEAAPVFDRFLRQQLWGDHRLRREAELRGCHGSLTERACFFADQGTDSRSSATAMISLHR